MATKVKRDRVKISTRVKNCQICKGNPPKEKGELEDFTYTYCSNPDCMLVIDYEKK